MDPNQQPQDFSKPNEPVENPTATQTSAPEQSFEQPAPAFSASPEPTPPPSTPNPTTDFTAGQPAAEQPAAFPAQAPINQQTSLDNPGKTLGIVSIVLSVLGLSLIGIILGIVSRNKSKAVGAPTTLGTIGLIVGIVSMVIGLLVIGILSAITMTAYSGIQDRAQATDLAAQVNTVEKHAEAYYISANDYPKSVTDFSTYPESTLPVDLDVNSAIYTNTGVTYVYCGAGAAQIIYLGETEDDKVIRALGAASSTEECAQAL